MDRINQDVISVMDEYSALTVFASVTVTSFVMGIVLFFMFRLFVDQRFRSEFE